MTIAHYCTLLRLLLIPLFVGVYLHPALFGVHYNQYSCILIVVLALGEASDYCDGYLARCCNQETQWGKILDPMADSLARLSVYFCFTQKIIQLPLFIPCAMLLADLVLSSLRMLCAQNSIALGARWSGKIKALAQSLAALIILALLQLHQLQCFTQSSFCRLAKGLGAFACGLCFFTVWEYVYAYRNLIQRANCRP